MKTKKKLNLRFYQNLGKLFYAIAVTDGSVKDVEIKKLKEIVKAEWLEVDAIEDNYNTDAAYQIEMVFDWLSSKHKLNGETCFKEFVAYKNEQQHFFTEEIKRLILKTASRIAESFSGKNKSELVILAKLDLELKKNKNELLF
jgi:hypothetical protein